MAAINGLAASVAWTGYTGLYASPGYIKPYRFNLSVDGGAIETTGYGASAVITRTHIAAPYSWSGSITCRSPNTPATGFSGSVSWSSGNYSTNVRDWNLDLRCGEKQTTAFDGAGIVAHTYIPLAWTWTGGFTGYIDSEVAAKLALPTVPGDTLATLTLKALENTGTTDDTLSGTAVVTQMGADVGVDGTAEYSYAFTGSGDLTAAGDNYGVASSGIWSAGALVTPTAGALTLTAATGRTYAGSAFPTGVSWRVGVDSGIEVVLSFRGSGALTIG